MNGHSDRLVNISERWFRLLQRLYPPDFRDDMGDAVVDTYRDRARAALNRAAADAAPAPSASAASCASPSCGCARSSTRCATAPANACGPRSRGAAAATGAATRKWRSAA